MNGKTKWIAALCLLPFIVLFGAFQIAPLVWIAVHSFFSESSGWGWGNYVDILTSPFYLQAFQFSLEISLWSSVYGLLIALVGSYSLRQLGQTRFHDFVMSFTNMTSNFAGVPLAFAFVILLGLNGCLTLLLRKYGLMESFNLYSKSGLIVLYTYFQIPLGVLLLYPAFDALGAYATVYALTTGNFNVIPIRISALVAGDISLDPNLASALAMLLVVMMAFITVIHQWMLRRSYLNARS